MKSRTKWSFLVLALSGSWTFSTLAQSYYSNGFPIPPKLNPLLLPPRTNSTPPPAMNITLAWNAATDPATTGYNLYLGNASGRYTRIIPLPVVSTVTLSNLDARQIYYFTLTSTDQLGNESACCAEISFMARTNCRIDMVSNTVTVSFYGANNTNYILQLSTNLVNWTDVVQQPGSNAVIQYNCSRLDRQFFRWGPTGP